MQQQVDQAQQALTNEQQSWNQQYQAEVAGVTQHNAAPTDCKSQASPRLIAAGVLAFLGLVWFTSLPVSRRSAAMSER